MSIFIDPDAEYKTPGEPEDFSPEVKKFLQTVVAALGQFQEDLAGAEHAAEDQPTVAESSTSFDDLWPNGRLWM